MERTPFGAARDGRAVDEIILDNGILRCSLLTYGAALRGLVAQGRRGPVDTVLGFDRMEDYEAIYVWGDEFRVEEVFMNYFTNAINHALGDRIIDVKMVKDGERVRISVFNTGNSIPEECVEHLWEKFYKVDKARSREYGGSGIGLSIVKAVMESMNQKYGVINYDNGVEFWFELDMA